MRVRGAGSSFSCCPISEPGLAQRPPHITEIWFNMVSARTHCPQCHRSHVLRLDEVFYFPNVDFFRCDSCSCMWHVEKGKDGPPSQTLLGHQSLQKDPKQSADESSRKSKR